MPKQWVKQAISSLNDQCGKKKCPGGPYSTMCHDYSPQLGLSTPWLFYQDKEVFLRKDNILDTDIKKKYYINLRTLAPT